MPRKREDALDGALDTDTEQDEKAGVLAELADLFTKAQSDQRGRKRHIESIVSLVATLDPKDYPELADNPVLTKFVEDVQAARMKDPTIPPGTILNKGSIAESKKPWTVQDLKSPPPDWREGDPLPPGHTQWHRFVPERNQTIIFDGIRVDLFRRRPFYGPKIFYDIYAQTIDAEEAAEQHAAFMFKAEGASVPADPTVLNQGTTFVRTSATKGTYYPGMGTGGMAVPAGEGAEAGAGAEAAGAAS